MFSFCGLNNKMTTSENINLLWHISVNALPLCSSVSDFHLAVWVSALCISAIRKGTWRLSPSDRKTTVRAKTVAAICSSFWSTSATKERLWHTVSMSATEVCLTRISRPTRLLHKHYVREPKGKVSKAAWLREDNAEYLAAPKPAGSAVLGVKETETERTEWSGGVGASSVMWNAIDFFGTTSKSIKWCWARANRKLVILTVSQCTHSLDCIN